MPYVRDSFWRGREAMFTSVKDMRTDAVRWCLEVAGQRSCRPLEGAKPLSVFAAVEAPALGPLPVRPFELASWSSPKVGPDTHVKVGKALYSVPWRLIGERVDARATWNLVQIFHKGELVATHVRVERGRQKDDSHYPPEKIAFQMRTPVWCRRRAGELGPNVATVVCDLLAVDTLNHLRSAQGVLGLADKYGPARLDAACARAIAAGDPAYRTIKGILAVGSEADPPGPSTGDGGAAAHLHGQLPLFGAVIPTATLPEAAVANPAATSQPLGPNPAATTDTTDAAGSTASCTAGPIATANGTAATDDAVNPVDAVITRPLPVTGDIFDGEGRVAQAIRAVWLSAPGRQDFTRDQAYDILRHAEVYQLTERELAAALRRFPQPPSQTRMPRPAAATDQEENR